MPKLPSKQQFDSVRFSNVNPTAASFGLASAQADISRGNAGLRAGLQNIEALTKREEEDNVREAKQLETEYLRQKNELLYSEEGLYNQRGNTALDREAAAAEDLKKIRNDLLSGVARQKVKDQISFVTERDQVDEAAKMDRFINDQRSIALQETSTARIAEYTDLAASDPAQVKLASDVIFNEVNAIGDDQGWSPEVRQQKMLMASTELHSGVMDGMLVENPAAAEAYLESAKSQMTNKAYVTYKKGIKSYSTLASAQAASDAIMARGELDDASLLELARRETNPEVREKTVSLVKGRIMERDRFEENDRKDIYRSAASQIIAGKVSLDQWAADNPAALVTVAADPHKWAALERAELRRLEGERYAPVSDGKTLPNVYGMDPDELASMDINDPEIAGKLTKQEEGKLVSAIKQAQEKIDRVQGSTKHTNSVYKVLRQVRPGLPWNESGASGTDEEIRQQNVLLNSINGAVYDQYLSRGLEPSFEDIQAIVVDEAGQFDKQDDFVLYNPFTWFDDTQDAQDWRDMDPDEQAAASIDWDTVHPLKQKEMNEGLTSRFPNVPITSDEKAEYLKYHLSGNQEAKRAWLQKMKERATQAGF